MSVNGHTDGIRWTINPGRGDFPVGQFDAQNLFPNGSGIPSFASSMNNDLINIPGDIRSIERSTQTLVDARLSVSLLKCSL